MVDDNFSFIKVIDPRGKFGTYDIYGDFRYELAKLFHSVDGKYDFIIKDLLVLKKRAKSLLILLGFFAICEFMGSSDLFFIMPFLIITLMLSTFSYDEYNKWHIYSITIPNGRKESIKARYLLTIVMAVGVTLLGAMLLLTLTVIKNGEINYQSLIINLIALSFSSLLILIIMITLVIVLLMPFISLSSLINILDSYQIYFAVGSCLLMGLLTFISYKISLKINNNKEY